MEEQFGTNKEMNMKLTFVPSCNQTTASVEKLKVIDKQMVSLYYLVNI